MNGRTGVLVLAALLVSPAAAARSYTPRLSAFAVCSPGGNCDLDTSGFGHYAAELGTAMAPKFLGPASTLGSMGYEVSLSIGLADINKDNYYWKGSSTNHTPAVADDPGSLLITNQIRVRKGLPYSLQIGGVLTHLNQSDLWGLGLEVGYAFHEGYRYFPDIALNASVSTLLGSDELALLQVGASFIVSKSFNVAGLFSLAPYAGYNFLYMNASSHLTATYPVDASGAVDKDQEPVQFALPQKNVFVHRGVIGLNAVATFATVGFEFGVSATQRTYAFKLGVQF